MGEPATGYADPAYAAALAEVGEPRVLPHSGGSLLVRPTPGGRDLDAIGPYPLFACADWSGCAPTSTRSGTSSSRCRSSLTRSAAGPRTGSRACFPDLMPPSRSITSSSSGAEPAAQRAPPPQRAPRRCGTSRWRSSTRRPRCSTTGSRSTTTSSAGTRSPASRPSHPRRSRPSSRSAGSSRCAPRRRARPSARRCGSSHGDVAYYHLGAYSDARLRARRLVRAVRDRARALRAGGPRAGRRSAPARASATARGDGLDRFKRRLGDGHPHRPISAAGSSRRTRYSELSRGVRRHDRLLPRLPCRRVRMSEPDYRSIVAHYEACLAEHGDTHLGVDWPNAEDVATPPPRHARRHPPPAGADPCGCSTSAAAPRTCSSTSRARASTDIEYAGLDISRAVRRPVARASSPANAATSASTSHGRRELAAAVRLRGHERRLHREAGAVVRRDDRLLPRHGPAGVRARRRSGSRST